MIQYIFNNKFNWIEFKCLVEIEILHYGEEINAPMVCAIMMSSKWAYNTSDRLLVVITENGTGLAAELI